MRRRTVPVLLRDALRRSTKVLLLISACTALFAPWCWAGVGGSISGTVKDSSGAVIPRAEVTAINLDKGVRQTTKSDDKGFYTFPVLLVGHFDVEVSCSGFKPYRRTGGIVDANSLLVVDAVLQVGQRSAAVLVSDSAVHVETYSSQMGEVINADQMTDVPLNNRSYTDLLSMQAGVTPSTSITSNTVQDVGASALSPSGDLNPGTVSIHGQREFANAFIVNGSDSEEDVNMGTAIIPNLDSIAEFRILTSNFDAEYGEFSGGQINVVTKSGSNAFHGDLFEFLRNTDLDARNYLSPTRGTFIQNQFGGTVGGPIIRNKIFFFSDYQGTRQIQGTDTGLIPVPSLADRAGNLSDQTNSLTGTVSGPYFASLLSQKLGYAVTTGEAYYMPCCTSSSQCVLPNATIPQVAWSAPAANLLKYIPTPNLPGNVF